jgi:hypothetical protein
VGGGGTRHAYRARRAGAQGRLPIAA